MKSFAAIVSVVCVLPACSTVESIANKVDDKTAQAYDTAVVVNQTAANVNERVVNATVGSLPVIPSTMVALGPSVAYPLEKIVYWGLYVGAAYLILDPLAPNWEIQEAKLDSDLVHFNLKMKRYHSGGDGEARVIMHRRARELARKGGFKSYNVIEYSEGIESSMLGSMRRTEAVVRFVPNPSGKMAAQPVATSPAPTQVVR